MIDWNKVFSVVAITRTTLKEVGLSDEEIAFFTDEKMTELASLIYMDGMHFLEDVYSAAGTVLGREPASGGTFAQLTWTKGKNA